MNLFSKFLFAILFAIPSITFSASYGTGFFITTDGYIATNNHVIDGSSVITVRMKNGEEKKAEIIRVDKRNDLAILKVQGKSYKPLAVISSSNVKRGEKVFAMGFPRVDIQGIEPKLTEGIVSSLSGIRDEPTTFQVSNAIQPGNSGGPLFNSEGKVIGIVVSTLNPLVVLQYSGSLPQNVNYAVKSNYLIELLGSIGSEKFATSGGSFFRVKKFTDVVESVEDGVVLIKVNSDRVSSANIAQQKPQPKVESNPQPQPQPQLKQQPQQAGLLTSKYFHSVTFSGESAGLRVISVHSVAGDYQAGFMVGDLIDSCYIGKEGTLIGTYVLSQSLYGGSIKNFDICMEQLRASPGYSLAFRRVGSNNEFISLRRR